MQIRRALVSVWDKSGVAELGLALRDAGVEVLSTGGTAAALREAGVRVGLNPTEAGELMAEIVAEL